MNQPAQRATPIQTTSSTDPPIGKHWGEFPPLERQAELSRIQQEWVQEHDHGNRPGPFADFALTGADVFWLAVLMVGAGDIAIWEKKFVDPLEKSFFDLRDLHLEKANLEGAQLHGTYLRRAQLQEAKLGGAQLQEADLEGAQLEGANLFKAQLKGANLERANFKGANLGWAQLEGANLRKAQLKETYLRGARLEGADLQEAQLEEADLQGAQLEGANLRAARMSGVDLREAFLDAKTQLATAFLTSTIQVADVVWNGVPLTRLEWVLVPRLGDEVVARQNWTRLPLTHRSRPKTTTEWRDGYQAAARAYRQLAIALREQGISDGADRFTYRALIMQRKALWWLIRTLIHQSLSTSGLVLPLRLRLWAILGIIQFIGVYLFSLFLAVLTGYGFRMSRILVAYGLLILTFGGAYWGLDRHAHDPLNFGQALIVSITAFHGRVFSYNPFTLSDPQIVVTAIEAICGLVIEGLFVAMLVQRFFNR